MNIQLYSNQSDIAPRISLAYKTGKDAQISAAYGIFYEKPDNQQLFFYSQSEVYPGHPLYSELSENEQRQIFRIEAYYKLYKDLVKTAPAQL